MNTLSISIAPGEEKKIDELGGRITPLYARAVVRCGIELTYYPERHFFSFQYGGGMHFFHGGYTPLNENASARIADNKYRTNIVLRKNGVPVAKGLLMNRYAENTWNRIVDELTLPVVIKPAAGTLTAEGVVTGVSTKEQALDILRHGIERYGKMLVEETVQGAKEYRVLVLDGKIIGVIERIPAHVVGDGQSTIGQLIESENRERASVEVMHAQKKIAINKEVHNTLKQQGLDIESIPNNGEHVPVKGVANFGAGGDIRVVDDLIHQENADIAIRATNALGLRLAGIDFLCDNIAVSILQSQGAILEVNQHPDIAMHGYRDRQKAQRIADAIVRSFIQ